MPTVFFLNRLKPGVDPEDYEQWVREVDYPIANSIPSILSYRTHRISGPYRHAHAEYDYIEVVEVTDIDDYRRDLDELPQAKELRRQIVDYLEFPDNYWGNYVEGQLGGPPQE
jgi:hypothetical protein